MGNAAGGCLCGELALQWSADAELLGCEDPRGCSAVQNDGRLSAGLLQMVYKGALIRRPLIDRSS